MGPIAGAEAASGQFPETTKTIFQNQDLNAPIITGALGDPGVQAQIDARRKQEAIAGTSPPAGEPVSAGLAGPKAVADITGKTIVAQAAPRAPGLIVPEVAPVDPLTGLAVGPGATTPAFSQAPQGPDTRATAATEAATTGAKAITDYSVGVLQGGITEGQGAQKVLNDVNQLRYLAKVMNSDGPMNQAQNRLASEMYDRFGLTLTQGQSAREVFNNYVAALMGDWRKDVGVQRLALPEIQLGASRCPTPTCPSTPSTARSISFKPRLKSATRWAKRR